MKKRFLIFIIIFFTLNGMNNFYFTSDGLGDLFDHINYGERFEMDMNISDTSLASFIGGQQYENSGISVSGGGDINGDGLDDILIGAPLSQYEGSAVGRTYLILGRRTGLTIDINLSTADITFIGENHNDCSGHSVSWAGDVNGDGYDDILIGAFNYDFGGKENRGKTYLIFGKAAGWPKEVFLSQSDVSFTGESNDDGSGYPVSQAGDVNGDGFDDFLIGASRNMEGGVDSGQTYLIFGRKTGWEKDTILSKANASFKGENREDLSGVSVSSAGDVNGDGFDDILIGALYNSDIENRAGKVYLVFGKRTGWSMDMNLRLADASFIGEYSGDYAGGKVAGVGDVNGDGYDDFLIGAFGSDYGGSEAGKTYLVLGKSSGWTKNIPLSNLYTSFVGENSYDTSGFSLSGAGDVNKDGYGDFLIGAYYNDEGGYESGQTYLIFGKPLGWSSNMDLSNADASFLGEDADDMSGVAVSSAGDVNGDGAEDFLIGAFNDEEGGYVAGQTYLISGLRFCEPLSIHNIKVMDGAGVSVYSADIGDTLQIQISGSDRDPTHLDRGRVNISFEKCPIGKLTISVIETGIDTGIYIGSFIVPSIAYYLEIIRFSAYIDPIKFCEILVDYPFRPSSIQSIGIYTDIYLSKMVNKLDIGQEGYIQCIGIDSNPTTKDMTFIGLSSDKDPNYEVIIILKETGLGTGIYSTSYVVPTDREYFENITLTSLETTSTKTIFMVHTPVQVRARSEYETAAEDEEYRVGFFNFGYSNVTWEFSTNSNWLHWDRDMNELAGTPNNTHVGSTLWNVSVKATDMYGNSHRIEFYLSVNNKDPRILTDPISDLIETENYYLNLDSDDDGQGEIKWYLLTSIPFLNIESDTGIIKGRPIEGDKGVYFVKIEVQDGNGGSASLGYNLTVHGKKHCPNIITNDLKQVEQDTPFRRDYDVFDPDEADIHHWALRTDADWLSMENETGVLYGTPDGYDVGDWVVNITVIDSGGLNDSREFILTVLNVYDRPRFDDVPADIEVLHGTRYHFDVNASDPDYGSVLTYSLVTRPVSDMRIDPNTGAIAWTASYRSMPPNGSGMEVTLKVSDGVLFLTHTFQIVVIPTGSPSVELRSPSNGARAPSTLTRLEWVGSDPEDEPLTYTLYIGETESNVASLGKENIERSDLKSPEYNVTQLIEGKTYYWTVIPDDGCTAGSCTSGVLSFRINHRPVLRQVKDLEAVTGEKFRLELDGSDADEEDRLRFFLIGGPDGMDIDAETGMISFVPTSDQIGIHKVTVHMSDGYETVDISFYIEVSKGSSSMLGLFVGAGTGVLLLLFLLLLIYIFVIRKKTTDEEEESKKVREDIEKHQKEKDWDESHTRPSEQKVVIDVSDKITAPPLTDQENPPTYEDLGSQTPPEEMVEQEGLGNDGAQRLVSTETETNETEHR